MKRNSYLSSCPIDATARFKTLQAIADMPMKFGMDFLYHERTQSILRAAEQRITLTKPSGAAMLAFPTRIRVFSFTPVAGL